MIKTKEEFFEYSKCSTDIIYFIEKYAYWLTPNGQELVTLRDYQKNILLELVENEKNIMLMCRQSGKTMLVSLYLLWKALFKTKKDILLIGANTVGMQHMMGGIQNAVGRLPIFLYPVIVTNKKSEIEFLDMKIYYTSGSIIKRGKMQNIGTVYVDEMAYIRPSVKKDMMKDINSIICSDDITIASSANGFEEFYDLWSSAIRGENEFKPHRVDWWEIPNRDEAWMEYEIKVLGSKDLFDQEYGNKFISYKNR